MKNRENLLEIARETENPEEFLTLAAEFGLTTEAAKAMYDMARDTDAEVSMDELDAVVGGGDGPGTSPSNSGRSMQQCQHWSCRRCGTATPDGYHCLRCSTTRRCENCVYSRFSPTRCVLRTDY